MKTVFYFVSGHGFGHAVRSSLVIRELARLGVRVEIFSSIPKGIFDSKLQGVDYGYHNGEMDIGVVQSDSISIDIPATYEAWSKFIDSRESWIDRYLEMCGKLKTSAIVCDIVPFAIPLARKAGLPSILVATFTWDAILNFYADEDARFEKLSNELLRMYYEVSLMISTPLSFGLPRIAESVTVPLIGAKCALGESEIRKKLGLDERPAFLVSFGGLGLNGIERLGLKRMKDYQFLFLADRSQRDGNLITCDNASVTHEELVKISRAVITKPGYGVSAECILNRTAMIYTSRGKFAEYEPLVDELKKYIPMTFISNEELFSGGLAPLLEKSMEFVPGLRRDKGTGAKESSDQIKMRYL